MTEIKKETIKRSKGREYIEAIVFALILALIIKTFFIQAFEIPSGSMVPTFLLGDRVLVNEFIFGTRVPLSEVKICAFREPERGEIVVFKPPSDFQPPPGVAVNYLIKRVIGLPGDTIRIIDKRLYVNGKEFVVKDAHWDDSTVFGSDMSVRDNFGPITVPPHAYFMMGDNRDNSYDSRFWGFVLESEITGKMMVIYWSWDITTTNLLERIKDIRWGRIGMTGHQWPM